MNYMTNTSKSLQELQEKETIIRKLSGLSLEDIIQLLAKGYVFAQPEILKSVIQKNDRDNWNTRCTLTQDVYTYCSNRSVEND